MKNKKNMNKNNKQKKTNAGIFIPHLGCPHECSFCDKHAITQAENSVTGENVRVILDNHAQTLRRKGMIAEIAFFGGTFTALEPEFRESLLTTANEYIAKYPEIFVGIRCSTRPDCIYPEVTEQLRRHGVTAIELGAQSMDDEVLAANNRGHTSDDVRNAVALIRSTPGWSPSLGLQMMTGLYKDTPEKSLYTADEIIRLKPDTVRIYPTVVFAGTYLAQIGHQPYPQELSADLVSEIYERFVRAGIRVIRIGLNPTPERYSAANIIGNYCPRIGELAMSRYYFKRILAGMKAVGGTRFVICTDKSNISKIAGWKGENKQKLADLGLTYRIKEAPGVDLEVFGAPPQTPLRGSAPKNPGGDSVPAPPPGDF